MNFFLANTPHSNTKLMRGVQIILLLLIVVGITLLFTQKMWLPKVVNYILAQEKTTASTTNRIAGEERIEDFDLKNATLVIEGESISLVDGASQMLVTSGSAEKKVTRYFGNEAIGDLNNDSKSDVVFLVKQETGGSGVFYYVVVALRDAGGFSVTNAVLLGDRIAPQTTAIVAGSGDIQVNYAERLPEEPMSATPSVGVTALLKINKYGVLERL